MTIIPGGSIVLNCRIKLIHSNFLIVWREKNPEILAMVISIQMLKAMKTIAVFILLALSSSALSDQALSTAVRSLLESGSTDSFVHVGNSTQSEFNKRRSIGSSCTLSILEGDAKQPIGDGSASNHALITCPGFRALGIRIKPEQSGKYHILGYWSQ
ncbi:hypothetical protein [uncultured Microbulbifer sp.]|uniref:hypothetical protein n=1 Tax=uncultured Microbulbifer sp. TaxID=348147 RepID=UPI00262F2AA3|nr:hypothetical protein [uncultured Microbulbifer sp.]